MIKNKKKLKKYIIGLLIILLCFSGILYNINFFGFRVEVPTGSMLPSIPLHDQLYVLRDKYVSQYNRGDIVVFHKPEDKTRLIKRLIGLPNDIVDIRQGHVFVNGKAITETYLGSNDDFTGTFFVPEDCYFFLGDNRSVSNDARYWEQPYISKDFIDGKVLCHIYPKFKRVRSIE